MSLLFKVQNKIVIPNEETLLVPPFKEIWDRDKDKNKGMAIKEFAYIEFMTSMLRSNPYREYSEGKKEDVILRDVINDPEWKPDSLVEAGCRKLIEFQEEGSITYSYWMSNKKAAEKMINFFNNFDIDERNTKTLNPIYKPKDITGAIADATRTLETLNKLKSKVDEEVFESSRNKSGKIISPFAKND